MVRPDSIAPNDVQILCQWSLGLTARELSGGLPSMDVVKGLSTSIREGGMMLRECPFTRC